MPVSLLQAFPGRIAFPCLLLGWVAGCSSPGVPALEPLLPSPQRSNTSAVAPVDSRRVEALRSPLAQQRLEALQAWKDAAPGSLPSEVIDLRTDPDPRVRAAVPGVLARGRPAQAADYLRAAMEDHDLQVRTAAVAAWGVFGGAEAQVALEEALKTGGEVVRAAAVASLAQLGAQGAVIEAAADRSWRVRLAVARELARFPGREAAALARRLLDDPSSGVQQEVVRAVAVWPMGQAGPILLEAMGKNGYLVRKTAAEQLASRWPAAREYLVDGPAERRVEVLSRLKEQFQAEIGPTDVILASADLAADRAAVQTAEHIEPLSRPTAESDRVLAALGRLTADEALIRRRAARELAEASQRQPLAPSTLARLAGLVARETDLLVCEDLLAAILSDGSEHAAPIAYAAAGHPSPEVRRRACQHLAAHPDARHIPILLPLLNDGSDQVAGAAARALGALGRIDDSRPLHRLLTAPNELLRVEAAAALTQLGDPAGPEALERLSYSGDHLVRRHAATAMGQAPKAQFVAALLRLLDDRPDVRRVALESLPKVVGQDVTQATGKMVASSSEQAALWKQWFALTHADERGQ